MNQKMDICYASSDEFAIHTGISILSLLENNPNLIDTVFILDYGILSENRERLSSICSKHIVECVFVQAKPILYEIGQVTGIVNFRNSYATYSRAFLDQLLPQSVTKVLYIDSDTVVVGSIEPLQKIDMAQKVLAGCVNSALYSVKNSNAQGTGEELNLLTNNHLYIHCGILLYNLKNWRDYGCPQKIQNTCKKISTFRFADQTLINNSIEEKYFVKLPICFNITLHCFCMSYNCRIYRQGGWYIDKEIKESLKNPVIIHYNGGMLQRPWHSLCQSRHRAYYLGYKSISAWKGVPLEDDSETVRKMFKKERMRLYCNIIAMKMPTDFMARVALKIQSII